MGVKGVKELRVSNRINDVIFTEMGRLGEEQVWGGNSRSLFGKETETHRHRGSGRSRW